MFPQIESIRVWIHACRYGDGSGNRHELAGADAVWGQIRMDNAKLIVREILVDAAFGARVGLKGITTLTGGVGKGLCQSGGASYVPHREYLAVICRLLARRGPMNGPRQR
jgi:hypothetical protein